MGGGLEDVFLCRTFYVGDILIQDIVVIMSFDQIRYDAKDCLDRFPLVLHLPKAG